METKLSEAEMLIMQSFWANGPMKTDDLAHLASTRNWKPTTTLTFLSRLVKKGMLVTEKQGKANLYSPIVSKTQYQTLKGAAFLNEIYDGSAKKFLAAMVDSKGISSAEINDLRQWLHCVFCFICREIRLRHSRTIFVRCCPNIKLKFAGAAVLCCFISAGLLAGCSVAAGAQSTSVASSVSETTPSSNSNTGSASLPLSQSSSVAGTADSISTAKTPESESVSQNSAPIIQTVDYIYPLPDRKRLTRGVYDDHRGLDFTSEEGCEIFAIADGEVLEAEFHYSDGNYVKIQHANGISSLYAHCKELNVKAGDTVKQGDVIAFVGMTGTATGNHLHLGVLLDNVVQDPLDYIVFPEMN